MTIKNKKFYMEQLWDWGFLDNCFGNTNIRVSDIDGFVERKGKFLLIECKSHNAPITDGQEIMYKKMIPTGLFTILIIWGEANKPERCELRTSEKTFIYPSADETFIQRLVHGWFVSVNEAK